MAPDPYGDYRGRDSGVRGFHVDGLRTSDYNQQRQCNGDRMMSQGRDLLKACKQGDGKKRDYVHGRLPSFLGSYNPEKNKRKMGKLGRGSGNVLDREPGELSGGCSSGVEDGVKKSEDEDEATSGKKRKLCSNVWNSEKKTSGFDTKTRNTLHAQLHLPSSPAKTRASYDPTSVKRVNKSEHLCASLGQKEVSDEPELMEEEYGQARTILSSRWADMNRVIEGDAGASYDVNFLAKRRNFLPLVPSQDQRSDSAEAIVGESSEGSVSSVSVFDDLFRVENLDPSEDKIDYLYAHEEEVDVEENDVSIETDSEVASCSLKSLEFVLPTCKNINMLQCCRSVDEFEKLNKINEGTYGIVYRARDKTSGEIVALKKVKMEKELEGFPLTSLREINILLSLHHPSIVEVKEVVMGNNLDGIFTVMEYMEHDLKGLMDTMIKPFHLSEIKCLMLQLLAGVKHLHDNWVLHRDLKASNILFNNRGELKICDFGLSRQYGSPLKPYTQLVVTLWYRAPELLLGAKEYSTAIDMWSVGCIMAELLAKEPLFPGKNELDQLDKIFRVLGTPDENIWPGFTRLPGAKSHFIKKCSKLHEKFPRTTFTSFLGRPSLSDNGFDLLNRLFTYDPEKRITAAEALNHPWFLESPLPTSKDFMPTFPVHRIQDRHQRRIMKIPDSLNLPGQ